MDEKVIVKIQRPIDTTITQPQALVYTEDLSYRTFAEFSDELRDMFGERSKVYCEAVLEGDELVLLGEVAGHNW